jgi:hypothetical protein
MARLIVALLFTLLRVVLVFAYLCSLLVLLALTSQAQISTSQGVIGMLGASVLLIVCLGVGRFLKLIGAIFSLAGALDV